MCQLQGVVVHHEVLDLLQLHRRQLVLQLCTTPTAANAEGMEWETAFKAQTVRKPKEEKKKKGGKSKRESGHARFLYFPVSPL